MKTFVTNSGPFLIACLLVLCSGIVRAQEAAGPPMPPTPKITVYFATYVDEKSQISVDDIKQYGFYCAVDDPAISAPLLGVLAQDARPDLTPAPPVNALFQVECEGPAATYTFGPSGIVWSGTHCYQLSREDRRTVNDIVRHQIFTDAFWIKSVVMPKAGKFADISTSDQTEVQALDGKPVIVSFVVDENGKVQHPRVVQSCGSGAVDQDAVDAVKHHKFTAATQDNHFKRARLLHQFDVTSYVITHSP